MQIKYYENHFREYTKDAVNDIREKQKFLDKEISDIVRPDSFYKLVSASTTSSSLFVSYKEFYIRQLDAINLYKDYVRWQRIGSSDFG